MWMWMTGSFSRRDHARRMRRGRERRRTSPLPGSVSSSASPSQSGLSPAPSRPGAVASARHRTLDHRAPQPSSLSELIVPVLDVELAGEDGGTSTVAIILNVESHPQSMGPARLGEHRRPYAVIATNLPSRGNAPSSNRRRLTRNALNDRWEVSFASPCTRTLVEEWRWWGGQQSELLGPSAGCCMGVKELTARPGVNRVTRSASSAAARPQVGPPRAREGPSSRRPRPQSSDHMSARHSSRRSNRSRRQLPTDPGTASRQVRPEGLALGSPRRRTRGKHWNAGAQTDPQVCQAPRQGRTPTSPDPTVAWRPAQGTPSKRGAALRQFRPPRALP